MALTDKLTAIGDAIRSKTGGSDLLTLDEMPQEIQSIQTGGGGSSEEYDDIVLRATPDSNEPRIEVYETQSTGEIRDYAFYNCYNLKQISIPNITMVRSNCFYYCTALEQVVLPNVTYMLGNSFRSCSSLHRAELDKSLISFGAYCFRDSALDTLILKSETVCPLNSTNVFQDCPIEEGTGYIYVPQALIEQYKVATNWATFANQFRAIEDYPEICGTGEVS